MLSFSRRFAFDKAPILYNRSDLADAGKMGLRDVSILMVARDVAPRFLETAIASCEYDLTAGAELILVDDGSIQPIIWRSPSIQLIRVEEPVGIPAARNIALNACTRRFFTFLDSDDELIAGSVAARLELLRSGGWDGVFGQIGRVIDRNGRSIETPMAKTPFVARLTPETLKADNLVACGLWLGLFRKAAADAIGPFDTRLSRGEDREWALRFVAARPTVLAPLPSVNYRIHKDNFVHHTLYP
ncbi:MAG: glycosyltransferase [Deltaproteobacteria bacterium]|nr:glycosyltransferase [Deltaproteobacteria bacterium]MBI3294209.1 glycosyltransferase [Deltaproteobacteria bacterium]